MHQKKSATGFCSGFKQQLHSIVMFALKRFHSMDEIRLNIKDMLGQSIPLYPDVHVFCHGLAGPFWRLLVQWRQASFLQLFWHWGSRQEFHPTKTSFAWESKRCMFCICFSNTNIRKEKYKTQKGITTRVVSPLWLKLRWHCFSPNVERYLWSPKLVPMIS